MPTSDNYLIIMIFVLNSNINPKKRTSFKLIIQIKILINPVSYR